MLLSYAIIKRKYLLSFPMPLWISKSPPSCLLQSYSLTVHLVFINLIIYLFIYLFIYLYILFYFTFF